MAKSKAAQKESRNDAAVSFPKPGEAWLAAAEEAEAALGQGAGVARLFAAEADGFSPVAEWTLGPLPLQKLAGAHTGVGLLRQENWVQALRFFNQSLRRTDPGGLAAVYGGLELCSLSAGDLQAAVRRREAAACYDGQRGLQGLALFGPGGPEGSAVLRYADGPPELLSRLLAFVWHEASGRGMAGFYASLPTEQARLVAAALPGWEPEQRRVLARGAAPA